LNEEQASEIAQNGGNIPKEGKDKKLPFFLFLRSAGILQTSPVRKRNRKHAEGAEGGGRPAGPFLTTPRGKRGSSLRAEKKAAGFKKAAG